MITTINNVSLTVNDTLRFYIKAQTTLLCAPTLTHSKEASHTSYSFSQAKISNVQTQHITLVVRRRRRRLHENTIKAEQSR